MNCIYNKKTIKDESSIAPDKKRGYPHNIVLFSNFFTKTCCGYSLEVPHQRTSNEYPQHLFLIRNKNYIYFLAEKRHLIWSYDGHTSKRVHSEL